jgi:cell division protein FtsA
MSQNIAVGIDIGTYHIKVVVAKEKSGDYPPEVLGTGFAESDGLRHGYIVDTSECIQRIKEATHDAARSAEVQINEAYLGLGVVSLESFTAGGTTVISRGDNVVTQRDIDNAIEESEQSLPESVMANREILETIPRRFHIDGKEVLGQPQDMKGVKLGVETLFITTLKQHMHDLVQAVEDAGIRVVDVAPAPLAASTVTLTKAQKTAGCVLANIGAETVSIIVFDNNIPVSIAVFPIGSTDITNDIALGLKIPLEEAEQIKLGGLTGTDVSKEQLDEIIQARLTDIFELIQDHLQQIRKDGLLPAGIIIVGGGSGITTIEDFAKAALELPSKVGDITFADNPNLDLKDPSWAVAYGLCAYGFQQRRKHRTRGIWVWLRRQFMTWVRRFLP